MSNRANVRLVQGGPSMGQDKSEDGSSVSVITYLRRKKKKSTVQNKLHSEKSGIRICEWSNTADIKVGEEGGGGISGARAEILL